MYELHNPATIRGLMTRFGLSPQKSLGQNFIISPAVCPRIAREGGARQGVCALEIGPGIGVLTVELAARCEKVLALELDKGLIPLLGETLSGAGNVTLLHTDALKADIPALVAEHLPEGMPVVVCANLPYYITSPMILRLLECGVNFESITVMVQKETARRMAAPLPSREAGAVTVAVAWRAACEILFDVPRGAFLPAPNVDSSVIKLRAHPAPLFEVSDEALLFSVIRAAFGQRRKTMANCISAGLCLPKNTAMAALDEAGIAPTARAEQLTIRQFAALANILAKNT